MDIKDIALDVDKPILKDICNKIQDEDYNCRLENSNIIFYDGSGKKPFIMGLCDYWLVFATERGKILFFCPKDTNIKDLCKMIDIFFN